MSINVISKIQIKLLKLLLNTTISADVCKAGSCKPITYICMLQLALQERTLHDRRVQHDFYWTVDGQQHMHAACSDVSGMGLQSLSVSFSMRMSQSLHKRQYTHYPIIRTYNLR